MANPLLAAYAAKKAAPAATTPAATPAASPAPSARPVQTTQLPPAAPAAAVGGPASSTAAAPGRSLAEMRARLAGRNGGVNPPEAKIADSALDPKTRETPDGGAEPLDAVAATSPAPAPSIGTTATETGPTTSPSEPGGPVMTRGQKAAATRAANKAKASSTPPVESSTGQPAPDAGSTAASPAAESAPRSKAEVYREIAALFEELAGL